MTGRDLLVALCLVPAVGLSALFLALVTHATWVAARARRLPVVTARVVGHEPAGRAGDRARHRRWRTVVAWSEPDGREVRCRVDPPPMEPGERWLREGDEVRLHADPSGPRAIRLDRPAQSLRSALLVGAIYLLLPAGVLAAVAARC